MDSFGNQIRQGESVMDRRELLRRSAYFAAAAAMVGGADDAFAGVDKDLELWAWQPPGNGYPETFAAAGKRWEKLRGSGSYKYTVVEFNNYFTKFKTAAAGGNPPDLMERSWTGPYRDLIRADTLRPLDAETGIMLHPGAPIAEVRASPRIGITRAAEAQWRLFDGNSRFVSRHRRGEVIHEHDLTRLIAQLPVQDST